MHYRLLPAFARSSARTGLLRKPNHGMKTRPIIFSLLLATNLGLARAEWRFDAETGALYNSNLSNSDRASDVRDDWAWVSNARIGNAFQLSRDLRLNVGADVRGEVWDRFGAFNEIGTGFSSGLRYRFGLGRQSPWVLLENRFGYDRFQNTAQSGCDEVVSLRGGIGLTERIALEGGYGFENFVAPDDFYDRQEHRGNVRLIVDLASSVQVAVGYNYREGDVISYAVPPRPDIAPFAIERENEDKFGNPLRTAYKLLGWTHAVSLSMACQLSKYATIQVDYEYAVTLHDPLRYENHLVATKIAFAY